MEPLRDVCLAMNQWTLWGKDQAADRCHGSAAQFVTPL